VGGEVGAEVGEEGGAVLVGRHWVSLAIQVSSMLNA